MQKHDCLVAFGSNLGDGNAILRQATKLLSNSKYVSSLVVSQPLVTKPIGGPVGQDDYVNACVRFQSEGTAELVFGELVDIEQRLGRRRRRRWGSRSIDLDLLLFGPARYRGEEVDLEVPHPRMTFRRFVLEPAAEIAADMVHPVTKTTLGELLSHILNCDNRLRLVADEAIGGLANEIEALCTDQGWEFVQSGVKALLRGDVAAKLNVYLNSEAQAVEPKLAGIGPILKLNSVDTKSVAAEISAAIDTLSSR